MSIDIMNVVGCHQFQIEFLRPLNQLSIHLRLFGDRVVLEFQIEIFDAERLLEPVHRGAGLVQLVLLNQLRNLACQTARKGDQAGLLLRQEFLVDARLVVVALQVRCCRELDEILVAGFVLRQQDQMVIDVPAAAAGLFVQSAARRDIHFAADDRLDALVTGGLVKINCAVENAVVGDRQRGKLQLMRLLHQSVETAGPVEQRILGVQMEMDKIRVRHEANYLPARRGCKKGLFTPCASTLPVSVQASSKLKD